MMNTGQRRSVPTPARRPAPGPARGIRPAGDPQQPRTRRQQRPTAQQRAIVQRRSQANATRAPPPAAATERPVPTARRIGPGQSERPVYPVRRNTAASALHSANVNARRQLSSADLRAPVRRAYTISDVDKALHRHSLRRVAVPMDGNCQFHSMAAFFSDSNHREMRRHICDFLRANELLFRADISVTEAGTPERYLAAMSRPGCWGDGITLQAFGLLFQVDVVLFMPTGTTQLHPQFERHVAFVREGEHYEPALPI